MLEDGGGSATSCEGKKSDTLEELRCKRRRREEAERAKAKALVRRHYGAEPTVSSGPQVVESILSFLCSDFTLSSAFLFLTYQGSESSEGGERCLLLLVNSSPTIVDMISHKPIRVGISESSTRR